MEAVFNDMAALANATASSFAQQQRQQVSTIGTIAAASLATIRAPSLSSSSTSLVDVSPSILTSPTLSSVSCESGVIVNGSSHCSSATNSPIASSSVVPSSNTVQKTVTSTPVSSMTVGMLSATLLAAASTPSLSSSATTVSVSRTPVPACSPISSMCPTLLSSTTTASNLAPATSAHQLLINGLSVTDTDMTSVNSNSLAEDPRALQLALELSMVGLNDSLQLQVHQHQLQQLQQQHLQHMQQQQHQKHLQQKQKASTTFDMSSLSAAVAAAAVGTNVSNTHVPSSTAAQLNQFSAALLPGIDDRAKKSQNMTECVPVPSSEHVAEIVGRQGCKIKALRAKTNTYIKTPVRGEEPVFVVTGRKEDVAKAKREILSAAEHFSVIRASRKPSIACSLTGSLNGSGGGCNKTPPGPPSIPGHVTIQVRVPYRVVGLVVGSKGSTIKHIQQETQTYIVTPSREKEPIFDVSGLPDNVQAARKQIEAHIAIRTGAVTGEESVIGGNGITAPTINSLSQILSDDISSEFLASIYKNGLCSTLDYSVGVEANATTSVLPVATHNNCVNLGPSACNSNSQALIHSGVNNSNNFQVSIRSGDFLNGVMSTFEGLDPNHMFNSTLTPSNRSGNTLVGSGISDVNLNGNMFSASSNSNGMSRSCSSASSTTSSKSASNSGGSTSSRPELSNIWKNLGDSLDVDEGIGESPNIWTIPGVLQSTPGAHYSSSTTSISPTDSLLRESNTYGQLMAIQNPLQQREILASNNFSSNNLAALQQQQMLLHNNQQLGLRRECLICNEKEVTAALVPCGHNMFCLECANRICASADSVCPACNQSVFHAMRILP